MATNINPHPQDVRRAVRLQSYPNSEIERETIQEVDQSVNDRIRVYEQMVVEQTHAARAEAAVDLMAGEQAVDELRSDVRWALERSANELQADLPGIAARYKTLRATAEKVIAALERADRNEQMLAARCADPESGLNELWDKWPMLRPAI